MAPWNFREWSEEEREATVSPSSVIGGDYAPYVERYREESDAAVELIADAVTLGAEVPESGYPVDIFLPPTAASATTQPNVSVGGLLLFSGVYELEPFDWLLGKPGPRLSPKEARA